MMNKILFRADGDAQIGLGHVMRCLALARMLIDPFSIRFAITEPSPAIVTLLEAARLTVISLSEANHEADFLALLEPDEIVVLDGYSFDKAFQQSIRSRAKKVAFIDDLATGHQVADVIINHAGNVTEADYSAEAYTRFYLGPHYALLRPEFLQPGGFGEPPTDGSIFINLGGADLQNTSLTVLKAIQQTDDTIAVHLVLGPFHPNREAILAFQSQLPNLTILENLSANEMVSELQQCYLAITACSTISYEACAVNRPLVAIVTADNQARLAQFLSEEKLALSVNFPTLLSRSTPVLALDQLLKLTLQSFLISPRIATESLANQRRYFDGRSPERFRKLFHELSN